MNQWSNENISAPVRLGYFSRLLLRFAGVLPEIAQHHPYDMLYLKGIGLQLLIVFVLIFALQGHAIGLILGNNYIAGYCIAFLTSFLIIAFERAMIIGDFFREGKLEYLRKEERSMWEKLSVNVQRFAALGIRLLLGVALSWTVVHFSTPSLFQPEIFQKIRAEFREENKSLIEAEENYKTEKLEEITLAGENIAALQDQLQVVLETRGQEVTVIGAKDALASLRSNLDEARRNESAAKKEALTAKRCASAEGRGVVDATCNAQAAVKSSGVVSCKRNCEQWLTIEEIALQSAANAREAYERTQKEIQQLNDDIERQRSNHETTVERQVESLRLDIEAARDRRSNLQSEFDAEVKKFRDLQTSSPKWVTAPDEVGLMLAFDTYDKLYSETMRSATHETILYLKVFVIFLEISVFASRVAGSSPGYSRDLFDYYQENLHRRSEQRKVMSA